MPNLNEWRELQGRFRRLDGRVLRRNAENIKVRRDILVHVITGRLKRSGRIETLRGGGGTIAGYRIIAGTDDPDDLERAPYASFEEFGTRFREGHPSLTAALIAEHQRIKRVDVLPFLTPGGFYASRGMRR